MTLLTTFNNVFEGEKTGSVGTPCLLSILIQPPYLLSSLFQPKSWLGLCSAIFPTNHITLFQPKSDISLFMDCVEEDLSEAQTQAHAKKQLLFKVCFLFYM